MKTKAILSPLIPLIFFLYFPSMQSFGYLIPSVREEWLKICQETKNNALLKPPKTNKKIP